MAQRMAQAGAHHEGLGQPGLVRAAAAEVGADGLHQGRLVAVQQRGQGLQPVAPLGQGREGLAAKGLALGLETVHQGGARGWLHGGSPVGVAGERTFAFLAAMMRSTGVFTQGPRGRSLYDSGQLMASQGK